MFVFVDCVRGMFDIAMQLATDPQSRMTDRVSYSFVSGGSEPGMSQIERATRMRIMAPSQSQLYMYFG